MLFQSNPLIFPIALILIITLLPGTAWAKMTFEYLIAKTLVDGFCVGLISLISLIELPFAVHASKKQHFIVSGVLTFSYSSYFHLYYIRPPCYRIIAMLHIVLSIIARAH